jgi:hypothetical protein
MFDEAFQLFLLRAAPSPPPNMSWVCNLYYFLALYKWDAVLFFLLWAALSPPLNMSWVCNLYNFLACSSEMLCYYCKTASLKGCQIEKFSPPRTWDATFNNTQKDYRLAINKTKAAGWLLKSSCNYGMYYVHVQLFSPFVHATTNSKWNSELPNIDPQSLCPGQKWWQTVLEIKASCSQWEGSACKVHYFFLFWAGKELFVVSLFPRC